MLLSPVAILLFSVDPVVTFSVDMTGVDLQGQVPTVNGTFNSWCGDCASMTDEDGDNVWTIDIELADGAYEYKFALGAWVDQEAVTWCMCAKRKC